MAIGPDTIRKQIELQKVLPVLRAPTFQDPIGIAKSLISESFPVMEFTLTANNALDAIEKVRGIEGSVVGCGTVTTRAEAQAAREAGAHFLVAPALIREVAEATDLPTMLAGFTPSELQEAWRLSGWLVKLFPSSAVGPDYIGSVLAVFPDLPLVATGGIVPDNAYDFIAAGATAIASSYPGLVGGHLETSEVVAGARKLHEAIERHAAAGTR